VERDNLIPVSRRRKNLAGCMERCIPNGFCQEEYWDTESRILHALRRFMTRILIADDHDIMRRGVRSVLESRRDVDVCEAENGLEAVQKTKEMKPDLGILDVSMPLLDGFSAARQIKEMSPLTPILIFLIDRTEAFLEVAQKIGVSGYISKSEDIPSLLKAVEAALHNHTYFPGLSTSSG
jgi:DNA-binding NarL/FixJ family response regulator